MSVTLEYRIYLAFQVIYHESSEIIADEQMTILLKIYH